MTLCHLHCAPDTCTLTLFRIGHGALHGDIFTTHFTFDRILLCCYGNLLVESVALEFAAPTSAFYCSSVCLTLSICSHIWQIIILLLLLLQLSLWHISLHRPKYFPIERLNCLQKCFTGSCLAATSLCTSILSHSGKLTAV